MSAVVRRRWAILAMTPLLAWPLTACGTAGGDVAKVDQVDVVGVWSNPGGATLYLSSDRGLSGTRLGKALLGGTMCPNDVKGRWSFHRPDGGDSSIADDVWTNGDTIDLDVGESVQHCLPAAEVRRDGDGLSLCLYEDPDSDCSEKELLRPQPKPSEDG